MLEPRPCLLAVALVSLAAASGCVTDEADTSATQDVAGTQYQNIVDFNNAQLQDGWYGINSSLAQAFTAACPGQWCTGAYADITPLTFSCSVTSKRGDVHDCAWTFSASRLAVDSASAAITVDAPTFSCHVAPKTTAAKLVTLLSGSTDPLHVALPGSGSLADALTGCLAQPAGAITLPAPSAATTYVAASSYYTSADGQAKWAAALATAHRGFDDVCGDTFCGSDYGDLQAMQLDCAITKSTGNVKSCRWVFVGSFAEIGKDGAVIPTVKTFACTAAMHGTLPQLLGVLAAAGTDNPIQRALPGETTSLYDALGGCLP